MARDIERKRYTDWVSHERQKARRAVARMEREAVKSGIYKKDYDTQMQFQNRLDDFRRRTESIIATTYSKKNPDSWKDAANELAERNFDNGDIMTVDYCNKIVELANKYGIDCDDTMPYGILNAEDDLEKFFKSKLDETVKGGN